VGRGQYVFVSHANRDKPKARFVVEALINAGIGVWLDNPEAMGFAPDYVRRNFQNLKPGAPWRDQIHDALEVSKCVLAICTSNFWERYHKGGTLGLEDSVVREEIAKGRGKLVMCRLDDFDFGAVPADLSWLQFADLSSPGGGAPQADAIMATRMANLIEAVKAMMTRTSELHHRSGGQRDQARAQVGPFLINRGSQEAAADKAIRAAAAGAIQAFFVAGPEDECLDEFRSRLANHTAPRCLAGERPLQELLVRWPQEAQLSEFEDDYANALAREWRIPLDQLDEQLAETRNRPVAAVSVIAMGDWRNDQKKMIAAWLKFWRQRAPPGTSVVPVLAVEMGEVGRPWKGTPPVSSNGISAARIWNDVGAAVAQATKDKASAVPFQRLDFLHPVHYDHGRDWLRNVVRDAVGRQGEQSPAYATLSRGVDEVLRRAGRLGVPMRVFAEKIDPHWRKAMAPGSEGQ
jgi:hypothetical protein